MQKLLQVLGGLLLGVVLLALYPAYIEWIDQMIIVSNIISTPSILITTLFQGAPLIGFALIAWVVYKALTAKHFDVK
jgi:hypothetical protein